MLRTDADKTPGEVPTRQADAARRPAHVRWGWDGANLKDTNFELSTV